MFGDPKSWLNLKPQEKETSLFGFTDPDKDGRGNEGYTISTPQSAVGG